MMSKRIQPYPVALLAVILTISVFIANRAVGARQPQRARVTTSVARNAAIVAATAEVLKQTSVIRQLPILRPVKSGAESRAAIERMLIKNLNERTTAAEMHATELSLKKFGLAPSDFQYRQFIIKLLVEQVAGYYDPKGQEFHLADWLELEGQKPVMAHELTHALQDQHFNLRRFEKWPHGDSDAELAAHALIEGDATLAMNLYLAENPLTALAFGRSLLTGVATEQYDQAPRAMRESLIFPYLQGSIWATQLYKRGGWPTVSEAYTRLPLSTEQILHPEKYFGYERPVKVVLPDVTNLLNAEQTANSKQQTADSKQQAASSTQQKAGSAGVSPAKSQRNTGSAGVSPASSTQRPTASRSLANAGVSPAKSQPNTGSAGVSPAFSTPRPTASRSLANASWRRIESDVNGEWNYYLILDQFLNAPAESKRAAAGWAGDRFAVYEGPNEQVFLTQVTAWDTENDAREFFDAYVKRTKLRYSAAKQLDENATESGKLKSEDSFYLDTNEGRVVVQLRGLRVVVLEGVPDGVNSNALANALW